MKTRFAMALLGPLALALGAAGPAVAAPPETFPTTCEIDLAQLLAADSENLPVALRNQSFIVGGDVPVGEIKCTRSAQTETVQLTCSKLVPGTLAKNFTTKDFKKRCLISFAECLPNRNPILIREADNQTFKAKNGKKGSNTIELELSCKSSTRN